MNDTNAGQDEVDSYLPYARLVRASSTKALSLEPNFKDQTVAARLVFQMEALYDKTNDLPAQTKRKQIRDETPMILLVPCTERHIDTLFRTWTHYAGRECMGYHRSAPKYENTLTSNVQGAEGGQYGTT